MLFYSHTKPLYLTYYSICVYIKHSLRKDEIVLETVHIIPSNDCRWEHYLGPLPKTDFIRAGKIRLRYII